MSAQPATLPPLADAMTARCPVSYMQVGVDRYVQHGMRPGDFLTALLSNDLKGAFRAADEHNTAAMRDWVRFMVNDIPAYLQGSPDKVAAWIEINEQARIAAEVSA